MKICSKCSQSKEETEFYIDRRYGRPKTRCKQCEIAHNRNWRKTSPAYPAWRKRQKLTPLRTKQYNLKKSYGISLEEFEAMRVAQDDCCAACGRAGWPGGKHPGTPCVDHDHTTNRVRGLLCSHCNSAIGYADDEPARLRGMAAYLEIVHGRIST